MKRILLSMIASLSFTYGAQNLRSQEVAGLKTFFDGNLSGFYHSDQCITPQICVAHDYHPSGFPRSILAITQNTPDELWNRLQRILGVNCTKPDTFQVSVQRSTLYAYGFPVAIDTANLRPHYALFKDAIVGNGLINNGFDTAISIEKSEIIPIRQTEITLTAREENISAHPDGSGATILSGDSFKIAGQVDGQSQWFFSYFKTTTGEQLLTLHAILEQNEQDMIDNHLAVIADENLPQNGNDFFTMMDNFHVLNGQQEYAALKGLISHGVLSDHLRDVLERQAEAAEAERQRVAAVEAERQRVAAAEAERQRVAAIEAERQRAEAAEAERQRAEAERLAVAPLSFEINKQTILDMLWRVEDNINMGRIVGQVHIDWARANVRNEINAVFENMIWRINNAINNGHIVGQVHIDWARANVLNEITQIKQAIGWQG